MAFTANPCTAFSSATSSARIVGVFLKKEKKEIDLCA
jgi:hypothetical protein